MTIEVAVVYHSGYGHTAKQAEAVSKGAASVEGSKALLIPVDAVERHWDDLSRADAILFGAPTYMGSLSAPFKTFMDATSTLWFQRSWKDKIAAGFTNSAAQNGDKFSSLMQLATFAAQHGMIWVGLDLVPGNNSSTGGLDDLNRLGSMLGAMAQSNADQSAEFGPIASDLRTAEYLGRRVAEAALRWKGGGLAAPESVLG
ncbi:flavodoxin family protein [Beijerinckia sp. L45]|uniref:flavodoxin family protein n=1 Tax=Beijerinckia sp. L45 TaxID=1641855 RepID=UPI00131E00C2|nr:flavodoxin family protein [Beijerinckia sp. L45]